MWNRFRSRSSSCLDQRDNLTVVSNVVTCIIFSPTLVHLYLSTLFEEKKETAFMIKNLSDFKVFRLSILDGISSTSSFFFFISILKKVSWKDKMNFFSIYLSFYRISSNKIHKQKIKAAKKIPNEINWCTQEIIIENGNFCRDLLLGPISSI